MRNSFRLNLAVAQIKTTRLPVHRFLIGLLTVLGSFDLTMTLIEIQLASILWSLLNSVLRSRVVSRRRDADPIGAPNTGAYVSYVVGHQSEVTSIVTRRDL